MANKSLAMDINRDEKLDISIERVEKINSPLLVIGLGGTGADIVRTVKRTFAERYILPQDKDGNFIPVPDKTAYLAIDSTMMGKEGLDKGSEIIDITIPGIQDILDPQERDYNLTPFERSWVNKNLDAASAGLGAGTYRQAARFMLLRKHETVLQSITKVLRRINRRERGFRQHQRAHGNCHRYRHLRRHGLGHVFGHCANGALRNGKRSPAQRLGLLRDRLHRHARYFHRQRGQRTRADRYPGAQRIRGPQKNWISGCASPSTAPPTWCSWTRIRPSTGKPGRLIPASS